MASLDAYLHQIIGDNLVPFTKRNLKLIAKDSKRKAALSKLEKFVRETISPFEFLEIMGKDRPYAQFRVKIENKLFRNTFQSPDRIEDAFELFGITGFWPSLENCGLAGATWKGCRQKMDEWYRRRNYIVHEMDRHRGNKSKHKIRRIERQQCIDCVKDARLVLRYVERTYWNSVKSRYTF